MPKTDPELLADWLERDHEPAFRELVGRYGGLVYSAARRTCADESLAAEVSQLVFIDLARKARTLVTCASLGGWLHRATLWHAANVTRKHNRELRKREFLKTAMDRDSSAQPPGEIWREIQPVLDAALGALSAKDREALLLRFYRSLPVREVAATLGITPAAAQKRIDRATERLREKLAKRGCSTAGGLAVALATGFAADAQVAMPGMSATIAKALAAGSLAPVFMKTASLAVAAVALVAAGVWIAMDRHSVPPKTSALAPPKSRPVSGSESAPTNPSRKTARDRSRPPAETGPIDWPAFVAGFPEMRRRGDRSLSDRIERRLKSMSVAELTAEKERVDALDVPDMYRSLFQEMVMKPMFAKVPEMALTRFVDHPNADTDSWFYPLETLGTWAAEDPEKATEWLDAQVAAGKLDGKSSDSFNSLRIRFESVLIGVLLPSDPKAAGRHMETVPADLRAAVLNGFPVAPADRAAFAELVRSVLPEAVRAGVIAGHAAKIASDGKYEEVSGYLAEIDAIPGERAAVIEQVPTAVFQQAARNRQITKDDVDALREWLLANDAGPPDAAIGKALGLALDGGGKRTSYEKLGELALQTGQDEVLEAFLMQPGTYFFHQKSARGLAEKITGEALRQRVLESFAELPTP